MVTTLARRCTRLPARIESCGHVLAVTLLAAAPVLTGVAVVSDLIAANRAVHHVHAALDEAARAAATAPDPAARQAEAETRFARHVAALALTPALADVVLEVTDEGTVHLAGRVALDPWVMDWLDRDGIGLTMQARLPIPSARFASATP